MVVRELLRFKWSYHEGVVSLKDKRKGTTFKLPIAYLESFLRAGITFKNAHKSEQLLKMQQTVNKLRQDVRLAKARKKPNQLTLSGLITHGRNR